MIITTVPNHPAPLYVSTPVFAVPAKLVRDTVYMPSSVAARLLGPVLRVQSREAAPRESDRRG